MSDAVKITTIKQMIDFYKRAKALYRETKEIIRKCKDLGIYA